MPQPYKVFTIYAREDAQYLKELRGQLRPLEIAGRIKVWSDSEINPGVDWENEIVHNLDTADIILILVSAAYYDSAYIHEKEIKYAILCHERGDAKVLPIIVRPCSFGDDPVISRLQVLPTDGKPVNDRRYWQERDDAWLDVVAGVKRTLDLMLEAEHRQEQNILNAKREQTEAALAAKQETERKRLAALHEKDEKERARQPEKEERERLKNKEAADEKSAKEVADRLAAQQRAEREAAEKRAAGLAAKQEAETIWQQEQQRQRDEAARMELEEQARLKKQDDLAAEALAKEAARKQREAEATRQRQEQARSETYRPSAPSTYSPTSRLTSLSWFLILGGLGLVSWLVIRNCWSEPQHSGTSIPKESGSESSAKQITFDYPMVRVEAGTFTMGSPPREKDRNAYECQHAVSVRAFRMGKYEVTQAQWKAVMGTNPSGFQNCDECPVENVSWNDVQDFLKTLNRVIKLKSGEKYRLPTEEEWEYAARGGHKNAGYKIYAGSNDVNSVAWYKGNSSGKTHRVGQKIPNELDLYDMSGNVSEWCQDTYKSYPCDPQFPYDRVSRCSRGGSWYIEPDLRSARRNQSASERRQGNIGFRLATG